MAKPGKKYSQLLKQISVDKVYSIEDAVALAKKSSYAKFDASIDLALNLGIDPKKADQNIRGGIPLPHGLGRVSRIVVFAKGEKVKEAESAGAEYVGGDELAKKIADGWLEFEHVVATPDMMGVVGRLGKILGPRSLMPNPKMGTVTFDLAHAIKELKAGRAQYRVDKAGIVHTAVGKASFDEVKLIENAKAVIEGLVKVKPSTSKGTYLKKITISATMGLGVKIDPAPFRS